MEPRHFAADCTNQCCTNQDLFVGVYNELNEALVASRVQPATSGVADQLESS